MHFHAKNFNSIWHSRFYYIIGYIVPAIALFAAFLFSFSSWLRLCSQACAQGHSYRLYGLSFESIGLTIFPLLIILHLFAWKRAWLYVVMICLLAGGLGMELILLYVQKYKIGSWCPLCVSISAALFTAAAGYFTVYFSIFKDLLEIGTKGQIMNHMCKGLSTLVFFALGFVLTFVGIGKENRLEAQENSIKEKIAFGNVNSPVEVYIFTDWECPACRALEPKLEKMAPTLMQKARITFVDDPVHDATMNYTPYNLSFMMHNKSQYFRLRQGLTNLANETKNPTDRQVEAIATRNGVQYQPLSYAEVTSASKYFDHLVDQYNVEGTPTVLVLNNSTKKQKKLEGIEISEESILKAIKSLSQH